MRAFTVDCGEQVAPFRFIARGVSSGGWTQRDGRMFRLVSLRYEFVARKPSGSGAVQPVVFTTNGEAHWRRIADHRSDRTSIPGQRHSLQEAAQ